MKNIINTIKKRRIFYLSIFVLIILTISSKGILSTFSLLDPVKSITITSNNVTVEYKAKLNNNATLGTTGNTTTTISYANDPYSTGTTTSNQVETTVKTFGINFFKHNSSITGLSGAAYTVYSDSALTTQVGTITTGSNGHGTIKGLSSGTY